MQMLIAVVDSVSRKVLDRIAHVPSALHQTVDIGRRHLIHRLRIISKCPGVRNRI